MEHMEQSPSANDSPASSGGQAVPVWFLTVVTFPILIGMLWFGRDFLMPIALATLLFILNMALIDRLDSATIAGRSVPRWLAYTGATALVFGLIVLLGFSIANQAEALEAALPKYSERLTHLKGQIENLVGAENVAAIIKTVENVDIEGLVTAFASSAAGVLGNSGLILMYLAFMLAERGAFAEKLPRLCKTNEDAQKLRTILNAISQGVQQYMWINAVTSAMSGTLAFVVMTVLGVDFAVPLALCVFFLNFIPNIGSFLAVLFPTTVALLQFDTLTPALIVVIAYGGGDAIIGNIVQPRLQGKSLNLSTLVVMFALTFWGMMWGGVGAFIAVPLTVVIMIVCSQIPGLQPYARLLSSDGILPGEHDVGTDQPVDATQVKRSNEQTASPGPDVGASEIDAELASMKRELLELKEERQRSVRERGKRPK
ncbi:AI-2E family transporter [Seohaeicola saemankumensis]|nr:AI-2E family transporter [Seohaeicola saemankumensis]MCA0869980.1 AI-2E family transporter [Seohaeicola saemankumensis]